MPQLIGSRRCIAVVVDAQATAKVDVVNGNACSLNFGHQIQDAVHGIEVRRGFGNLGANVAVNAHHFQTRQGRSALIGLERMLVRHTKLIAL